MKSAAIVRTPSPFRVETIASLGLFVAAHRKAGGYTQQQFADLAGVGRRFVSELEGGKPTVETGKVLQVLTALGVDVFVQGRQ